MASGERLVGEVVDDRYEVEALVGQGGMGAVYRARHLVTGRRVAIKWLLEDDEFRRQRFLREARAMARVDHPNVVQVHDVGVHDRAIYFVMDFLRGHTLRHFVDEKGMPASEAIEHLMPALVGVEAAHRAGVLHRDLKPENLFVCCDRDGTPYDTRVLDFGVAKLEQDDGTLTRTGSVVGTPKYMAPEQVREEAIDERADVFALGLMLYELLLGRVPYAARTVNALLIEIGKGVPDIREQEGLTLPEGLAEVVMRAVALSPDDRFLRVSDLGRALEPFAPEGVRFEEPRDVHRASMPAEPLREPTPETTTLGETRVEGGRVDEHAETEEALEVSPPPPGRFRPSFPQVAIVAGTAAVVGLVVHLLSAPAAPTEGEVGSEVVPEVPPAAGAAETEGEAVSNTETETTTTEMEAETDAVSDTETTAETEAVSATAPESESPAQSPAARPRMRPRSRMSGSAMEEGADDSGDPTRVEGRSGILRVDDF